MEPTKGKIDEPFGRQPLPVTITITGHDIDVQYWFQRLRMVAESCGDNVERQVDSVLHKYPNSTKSFKIYPRAVND